MKLYDDYETDFSYKYLREVINILDEPICILGGWAVYFTGETMYRMGCFLRLSVLSLAYL